MEKSEKKEYSFDELTEKQKINAVFNIDQGVRIKLGLPTGARMVDRPLIECIIKNLETIFEKEGKIKYYSKKYQELTNELLKEIYEQCSNIKFRINWAFKWIKGDLLSYLNNEVNLNIIKGEIKTAERLGMEREDFMNIMGELSNYKETENYKELQKIFKIQKS